jgi:hypothetical protein
VTFLWLPLIPLRSWRIVWHGERRGFVGMTNQGLRAISVPLNLRQVAIGYACSVPIVALVDWLFVKTG